MGLLYRKKTATLLVGPWLVVASSKVNQGTCLANKQTNKCQKISYIFMAFGAMIQDFCQLNCDPSVVLVFIKNTLNSLDENITMDFISI